MREQTTEPHRISQVAEGMLETQRMIEDLTANWDAFCEADPLPHPREDFPESLERAGYAELVPVDAEALESPFAAELGIERGGSMWRLTQSGRELKAHLESMK